MGETNGRVKNTIIDALILNMTPEDLDDDDDLSKKLGIDSVGYLEILTAIEEEFDIQIRNQHVTRHSTNTVRKLCGLVEQAQSDSI